MSEKRETPHSMSSREGENELPRAEINADEEDVYAQLAQKERDLILAAELGKALLDSNQELQSRYDQMVEEYTHKVEELQQEKYDLHLELEKMGTEYQNTIKDLQDDLSALRKQARASDELQMSERERSRSLREAQQNSDYLMEQVKKASLREEELMKELDQMKIRNESSFATMKDQIDHISMLRDQVEYLSEKLRETNKKIMELQEEKDVLISTLEATQENLQILEEKHSEQELKIQRQASDIEELQESNADLLQQLQQRQSAQYHQQHQLRTSFFGNRNSSSTKHNSSVSGNRQNSHNLFFELNQEKQKQTHFLPQVNQQQKHNQQAEGQDPVTHASKEFDECNEDEAGGLAKRDERSHFAELALGNSRGSNSSPSFAEFSSMCRHSRNTGDCSICCMTEGSRKRHHHKIGSSSDDDDGNGPKQSLYSESQHHGVCDLHGGSANATMDSNLNQISCLTPSQFETHNPYRLHESESFQKGCLPHNASVTSTQDDAPLSKVPSHFEDTSYSGGENNDKSLYSELSPYAHEFCPRQQETREQSLFSELSSQLYDDRNGSGSDSSSNCMLGAFDFCSNSDVQDVDRNSNESLNRSMEMRSRIESDMSYVSDWYYMTPVTSEMLEEDDFECDDDDFLIGNMAGTTLSISDSNHGLSYHYHGYISEKSMADQDCGTLYDDEISCAKELGMKGYNKQAQLSEACRQLSELVIRVQGEDSSTVSKAPHGPHEDIWEASTDMLLSLVVEMRACVDKMTTEKGEQLQSSDISTTVKDEAGTTNSGCTTVCLEYQGNTRQPLQQQNLHLEVGNQCSLTETEADARDKTWKHMRKSKSSSSLA